MYYSQTLSRRILFLSHFYKFWYCFQINDIKRANGLITEQDFYALKTIKIPVKRHSMLTDERNRRADVETSLPSTSNATQLSSESSDCNESCQDSLLPQENGAHHKKGKQSKEQLINKNDTSKYLNSVDKEIRKTVKKNSEVLSSEKNATLNEVVPTLGSIGFRQLAPPRSSDECNGSDWGVKWWVLLLFFVAVSLVVIIIICFDLSPL